MPSALNEQVASANAQPAFAVDLDHWHEWLSVIGIDVTRLGLLDRLDRRAVSTIVRDSLAGGLSAASNAEGIIRAYVAVNAWGHGDAGYGPSRVAKALAGVDALAKPSVDPAPIPVDSTVLDRLGEAARVTLDADYARTVSADDGWSVPGFPLGPDTYGYYYLNNTSAGHIKNLGPAFFTKWLWAVSTQGNAYAASALPILDNRVMTWINSHTDAGLVDARTSSYGHYVDLLRQWASETETSPTRVEEAIFALTEKY